MLMNAFQRLPAQDQGRSAWISQEDTFATADQEALKFEISAMEVCTMQ